MGESVSANTRAHMVQRIRAALVGVLAASLTWPVQAATDAMPGPHHWQDKRYIEQSFYDIAMRGEYERVRPVIRKWTQPLRIWLYSGAGDRQQQRRLLDAHFLQLAKITGLPTTFVPHREQANVRILFAGERELHEMAARELSDTALRQLDNSMCIGQIRFNPFGQIIRGAVVIPVERAQARRKLLPCVVEEVTQMLGLINDTKRFHPTVFSDLTDDELLTGLDFVLLKLLYSPQLRSGMTYAQVTPLIRRQLDTWERNGLIRRAPAMIADSPLRTLTAP